MLPEMEPGHALCRDYLTACEAVMRRIHESQGDSLAEAGAALARTIAADRLVHVYGPGGHSNLATQEIFYRAGGLMHISPILDPGTLLSAGALRSTAMERLPGYGRVVIEQAGLRQDDVLLLVNAFGVNSAVIDAAFAARELGVFTIGFSGRDTALAIPANHPARHASGANLHDIVDLAIDTGVPGGDAALQLNGIDTPLGPVSTYANAFALNALVLHAVAALSGMGVTPPIWRSRNAPSGDSNDAETITAMRQRVPCL